jgi:hypothetical protein
MRTTMREGASGCVTVRPYRDRCERRFGPSREQEVLTVTTSREPVPAFPERLRLFAHLFVAAMVLTWIFSATPYPWRFATIATSGLAVIFAAMALWATVGLERTLFMRMVFVAGGVLAMVTALSGLASLVMAPELIAQSQCEQRALTPVALDQCEDEFWDAVEERLPVTRPNS